MQYRSVTSREEYTIRLQRGEKVIETLVRFCAENEITQGVLSAIGAVERTSMGYYDFDKREYFFTDYPDTMEVVSLTGNIAYVDGSPFIHAHVVLSDTENKTHGGHLVEADVAVTLEVTLTAYEGKVERKYDEETGLKLLELE